MNIENKTEIPTDPQAEQAIGKNKAETSNKSKGPSRTRIFMQDS